MGNKAVSSSALPSFESASSKFTAKEISVLKENFRRLSSNKDYIPYETLSAVLNLANINNINYFKKLVLPKFISLFASKKNNGKAINGIDYEDYVSFSSVAKFGSMEDQKVKLVVLMYEGSKNGNYCLRKSSLKQLLVDAMICTGSTRDEVPLKLVEEWVQSLSPISDIMVDSALTQFSSQKERIEVSELLNFLKIESSLQTFLTMLFQLLDFTN